MNKVTKILNIEEPVIQGAMAFVSTSKLVSAVSNAGGLGTLGIAYMSIDKARKEILATKKLTDKPFAANIILNPGLVEKLSDLYIETKVPVVYADGFNWPEASAAKYFPLWKKAGMKIIVKASDVRDAIIGEKYGADLIIGKGWEGGGHVAYEATGVLIPEICDAVQIPVVAAGGIVDDRGFASAFALGAQGVELGTIFLASKELDINTKAKDAVINSKDMQTAIISNANDAPFRMLSNNLSKKNLELEANSIKKDAAKMEQGLDAKSIIDGMYKGDVDNGAIMCGQAVSLVNKQESVKEIIDNIVRAGYERISKLSSIER